MTSLTDCQQKCLEFQMVVKEKLPTDFKMFKKNIIVKI